MADIFISYSSKDREKAEQLTELLSSAGLSVWIDKSALEVSTSWSAEIVDAISSCSAFIVLLSPNSIASHNVIKEVSLASEKRKKILPLDLEPIALPRELEYQLAGIHRTSMTNIDSIIRALGKLGLEATQAPTLKLVKETDSRKSLMILPFDDLSPTGDNGWFADGIVSEMISSLSNVKSLKITDAQTTKEYKNYNGQLTVYAREMHIRYFVQGDVRKFGDNIKVTSRLLDIESGDYLWQDSLKGTMDDIFDIQESVARKIVDGLQVILSHEEDHKLDIKLTENPEAYECYLKAVEFHLRYTRIDFERALSLFGEAVRLDPRFAGAHLEIASASLTYYRWYSRENALLERARKHLAIAEDILGQAASVYRVRSVLARTLGNYEEAIELAERATILDPEYALGFDSLGFAYKSAGKPKQAAEALEKYVLLRMSDRSAHFSLLSALNEFGDAQILEAAAKRALPIYQRHLRLTPDDLNSQVYYANILYWSGNVESSLKAARELSALANLDGASLYNLGCLLIKGNSTKDSLLTLHRSLERGFLDIETFRRDPDLDPLRGTPEFDELTKELEAKLTTSN